MRYTSTVYITFQRIRLFIYIDVWIDIYIRIHTYTCVVLPTNAYISFFPVLALPLAVVLGLARPLVLSLSRALVLSAIALSRSCSLALLLTRSLFVSLSRSRSHPSRTHTHACCSHTSCLFRRLPFHSLSLTLGLNRLMIPKQGESTCDTCCVGLGGGVTRVMQGNTLVSSHCFESNPHYHERQFPIVMSSMFTSQLSLCLIQRIAACRSVSQCAAAFCIVHFINTWEAAGSSMLHEDARCISLSPKIPGSLVLKTSKTIVPI